MGYDVFFSYARLSNGDADDERGVVSRLVDALRSEISQGHASRRAPEIFYDVDNLEAGDLDDNLVEAVRSSQLFVMLLSRRYLHSAWCMRELQAFIDQHGDNAANRVFILDNIQHGGFSGYLTELPPEAPASLVDFIGRQAKISSLIRVERKRRALTIASLESGELSDFFKLVVTLSDQIARRLRAIELRQDPAHPGRTVTHLPPPPPAKEPNAEAVKVMFGDANENARYERDRLRRHFTSRPDVRVLPKEPNGLLYDLGNLDLARKRSEELISDAQLFVLLLGAGADEAEASIGRFTLEQLESARRRGLTPLVWASRDTPDEEFAPHEQKIIKAGGVERVTTREFRNLVSSRISEIAQRTKRQPVSTTQKGTLLFFNGIGADRDIAHEAIEASGRADKFDAFLMPRPDGFDKLEYDALVEQHYIEADRSFIVGAEASAGWLPRQVRFYVRARRNASGSAPARVIKPHRLTEGDIGFRGKSIQFHDAADDRKQTVTMLAQLVREACDGR